MLFRKVRTIPAAAAVVVLLLQMSVANMGFAQVESARFNRGGLTLLLGSGVGINGGWPRGVGLGGPSLGIGDFLEEDLAVMVRGTGVFSSDRLSYVVGLSLQYWLNNRFSVEGGPGVGAWMHTLEEGGQGFGLIVGTSYTVLGGGMHSLQVGVEYAFFSSYPGNRRVVRNLGLVLRYQLL